MKNSNTAVFLLSLTCVSAMSIISAGCSFSKEGSASPAATEKQESFEDLMNSKCTVVYSTADIPEDEKLSAQSVSEKSIPYRDAPIDAITSAKNVWWSMPLKMLQPVRK